MCTYLAAIDNGTIATEDLYSPGSKDSPLPNHKCQQLLQKYFFNNKKQLSFSILNIFLSFLSNQLIKFSLSQFFTVKNLKAMGADPNLRKELFMALLQVADEFSHRSAGASQLHQVFFTYCFSIGKT